MYEQNNDLLKEAMQLMVKANGNTARESKLNLSKRRVREEILSSPTLSYVRMNDSPDEVPVIISEDERIKKKRFLFLPDTEIKVGDLIHDQQRTYLILLTSDVEVYPQSFGELCNHDYVITHTSREVVGINNVGRPIYEEVVTQERIPSIRYSNVYSTLGNNVVSLPSGVIKVRIPYSKEYLEKIHVNDLYEANNGSYQITEIVQDNVFYEEEGFLELTLQRRVEKFHE